MTRVVAILAVMLYAAILALISMTLEARSVERSSLEARVAALERQLQRRVRPIIQVNRASIYNTDGEVIVEKVEK